MPDNNYAGGDIGTRTSCVQADRGIQTQPAMYRSLCKINDWLYKSAAGALLRCDGLTDTSLRRMNVQSVYPNVRR